jgi:small subunit ribosomal protein S21|tara:strand:- start:1502 stop:1915 length:414 start_codon:yes stop_codon:yes gene_type:complete
MKNNNWTKKTVDRFNTDKKQIRKDYKPKEEQMKGTSISVWNGDVNGALRKLKKILERADRQKELSKREFYEKPSAKRKRKKDAAVKRTRKAEDMQISKGEWMPHTGDNLKSMKGKREKRKAFMQKQRIKRLTGRRLK